MALGMNGRPIIHTLLSGHTGSWKSSVANTWPGPLLVFGFDPPDKMTPYAYGYDTEESVMDFGQYGEIAVTQVLDDEGTLRAQIEHYNNSDHKAPYAWACFEERLTDLRGTWKDWGTVVWDSQTFAQIANLKHHEVLVNPAYKDPRLWYGDMKRTMTNNLMMLFANIPTNTVVICHTSEDKEEFGEGMLRTINAVGKLATELPAGFGENYHMRVRREGKNVIHEIQTQSDGVWHAASQIRAPNPCAPNYEALWENYDKEKASRQSKHKPLAPSVEVTND